MLRATAALLAAALVAGTAAAAARPEASAPPPLRVLFVGNSLTATNDLPAFVAAIARRAGDTGFSYRTIAPRGVSLEDHWRIARTRRALATGQWDVVVFQQGPSGGIGGPQHLCHWARRFADLARSAGARPYLLGVWSAGRFGLQHTIATYAAAAEAAEARLVPVGSAWAAAWRRKPSLALHGRDGIHPTRLGTYIAALVVHGALRGTSPLAAPAALQIGPRRFRPPRADAAIARAAAAAALADPPAPGTCGDGA